MTSPVANGHISVQEADEMRKVPRHEPGAVRSHTAVDERMFGPQSLVGAPSSDAGSEVANELHRRICLREAKVGVIGLGYVGLPLSVAFGEVGFAVIGFDVNADRVRSLNEGRSHIPDVLDQAVARLSHCGNFHATMEMSALAQCDVISICVPTPLSKTRDPDVSYVVSAAEQVARFLREGQLMILESTTYPGTTRDVILPLLEATGLRAGSDFFLAFSPERVDPGNLKYGIHNTPKIVGGIDDHSTALATLFFSQVIERVVPVSSPEAAEMAKLHENTFRAVNIALANETALMCDRLGLDVWEVIEAASTKPFGFMPFWPGPGIGGHCIPLDPYYLSWKMKVINYRARFIELAGEINAEMPFHVVGKVVLGLNELEKSVKGSRVLVIGVAYKADIDDFRESPALDIIGLLQQRGATVSYSDPHVPSITLGDQRFESAPLTAEEVAAADCVVIATNHRDIDYGLVTRHASLIVDTRNALQGRTAGPARVIAL